MWTISVVKLLFVFVLVHLTLNKSACSVSCMKDQQVYLKLITRQSIEAVDEINFTVIWVLIFRQTYWISYYISNIYFYHIFSSVNKFIRKCFKPTRLLICFYDITVLNRTHLINGVYQKIITCKLFTDCKIHADELKPTISSFFLLYAFKLCALVKQQNCL